MKKTLFVLLGLTLSSFSDIKINNNTSLNGSELSSKFNTSLSSCLISCETNKKCVGINYVYDTKRCGLLLSYSSRIQIKGSSSGLNYSDYSRLSNSFDKGRKNNKKISSETINKKVEIDHSNYAKTLDIPDDFNYKNNGSIDYAKTSVINDNSYAKTVPIPESPYKYPYTENKIKDTVKKSPKNNINKSSYVDSSNKVIEKTTNKIVNGVKSGFLTVSNYFSSPIKKKVVQAKDNVYENPPIVQNIDSEKDVVKRRVNYGIATSEIASIYENEPTEKNKIKEEVITPIEKTRIDSTNSFVTDFSNKPIVRNLSCKLYDKGKLIISKKCIVKEYFFDHKTRYVINFLNGAPFRFEILKNGEAVYLNERKQIPTSYKSYLTQSEFSFTSFKLVYFK